MPITREEALHVLDLDNSVTPGQVEDAVQERRRQIEQRLQSAPTEALKEKYRRQLQELTEAQEALLGGSPVPASSGLSQTMLADLPLAQASYTRVEGSASAAGNPGVLLKPGQNLAGRYEIEEQIGAGGMGVVYRAFDKNRDKDIAIKVLLPSMFARPKARERFLQEARLSSEMSHPHIVTVFDVQQNGAHTFLTMELLRGQSLRQYLTTLRGLRKTMGVDEALKIADQVCQGLAYAHEKGAVHRDIKPENIWLGEDGKAKVMDFGIARLISTTQMTQTQLAIGTAYYMAPEQLQGLADIDGRADQYAVAVMLYEMLTGQVPTGRIEPLSKVRREVPGSLSKAVDIALSARCESRFADMDAFRAGLRGKGLGFSKHTLIKVGGGLIAAGLLLGVIASYPVWKALLPDREQEAVLQQTVARLGGEAKALQKRVEEQRREVAGAAANAKRELERIEAQLNSVKGDGEKQVLQLKLWESRNHESNAATIAEGFRNTLEGSEGLAYLEGELKAAEAAQKAKQWPQAKEQLEKVQAGYLKLTGMPERLQHALQNERSKSLAPLEGKWSNGDCKSASAWSIKDPILSVYWPKAGAVEERIIDVTDGGIITVVITPAQYKGRLYRYQPQGKELEVSEVNSGRREVLKRCS